MHWRVTYSDPSALTQILKFLVRQEVIPGSPQTPPTPAPQVECEFRVYLQQERGPAVRTVRSYDRSPLVQATQDHLSMWRATCSPPAAVRRTTGFG